MAFNQTWSCPYMFRTVIRCLGLALDVYDCHYMFMTGIRCLGLSLDI